jgi:UDP-N-acetylmuramate: L-alanyl-gamma-D-glutamyl-meso-diaminopimelate ligase
MVFPKEEASFGLMKIEELQKIASELADGVNQIAYGAPQYRIENGKSVVIAEGKEYELQIFGKHNLCNLEGAREVCKLLGVTTENFYKAASTFSGAGRRLELIKATSDKAIYRDFAHSPSKLKATVAAVKEQFPERKLVACMELHTFSSLSENFLEQYAGTMNDADVPVVYFNPQTIAHKKLAPISTEQVAKAFENNNLVVFTDQEAMRNHIQNSFTSNSVLLMMSSGTFDGLDLHKIQF